jgi:hypothetical protein
MSVISDIEKFFKATGTDAEGFAKAFARLFKKTPAVLQVVENFLGEVAPIVVAAVSLADPIAEPEVAGALAVVETGLAGLQAAATAAVSGTSLVTGLENFAATVPMLLSSLAIKNPALQKEITSIVNLVVNECKVLIPAVESWVAQIEAAKPVAIAAAA